MKRFLSAGLVTDAVRRRPLLSALLAVVLAAATSFVLGVGGATYYFNKEKIDAKLFSRSASVPHLPDSLALEWREIPTGLHAVEVAEFPVGRVDGQVTGGAIDQFGDFLIYASANGHLATTNLKTGELAYSDVRVPMDYQKTLEDHLLEQSNFQTVWFRLLDIYVSRKADGSADLYVSHHKFLPETQDMCIVVSRTQIEAGDEGLIVSADWTEVYRSNPCVNLPEFNWIWSGNESGGRIVRYDDDHLLVSFGTLSLSGKGGTGLFDTPESDLGKIIKLNTETGEKEMFVSGLRNPQGLVIAPDGRVWETEHGPQGGDEVNLLEQGADYGWPRASYGTAYGDSYLQLDTIEAPLGRHSTGRKPVFSFTPSIGISNLVVVTEDAGFPNWVGDLLVTSLRGETIYRLRLDGDAVTYAEAIVLDERLRDIIPLDQGGYAVLVAAEKKIFLLRSPSQASPDLLPGDTISGYEAVRTLEQEVIGSVVNFPWGRGLVANHCGTCHSTAGEMLAGPPLNGIVGAEMGALDYSYSPALAEAEGTWTKAKLKNYIRDPQGMFANSTMQGFPESRLNNEELNALVDYLADETTR